MCPQKDSVPDPIFREPPPEHGGMGELSQTQILLLILCLEEEEELYRVGLWRVGRIFPAGEVHCRKGCVHTRVTLGWLVSECGDGEEASG